MTVTECSKKLGCSPQFLRFALQKGLYPFGVAVKMSSVWTYHIDAERFELWKKGVLK